MYITKEADYAIRCILYLAKKPDAISSVAEISKTTHAPKDFLAKIVHDLVRAGIIKSARGIKGGFQLLKRARDITLLDVVEAVQGPFALAICTINKKACVLSNSCVIRPVFIKIGNEVKKWLKRYNFARLILVKPQ